MSAEGPSDSAAHDTYAAARNSRRWTIEEITGRLTGWLAGQLGADSVALVDVRYPQGAGTSSETILTTACWTDGSVDHRRDVVFRMAPDRFQLFLDPDFLLQARVLQVLHGQGRQVPEVLFVEDDADAVGLPFFVMAQALGHVPVTSPPYNQQGFLADATPTQRRTAWESAVSEMARFALTPLDSVPFLTPSGTTVGGLDRQLDYWRRSLDWVTGGEPPDVLVAYAQWLEANKPADRPNGFSWGDARPGNMVFGPDFEVAGVLDWEQANDGGTRQDLGWWLYFDHFNGEGRGITPLDGLLSRQETIDLWESITGETAGDLSWHEVFTGFKVAILSTRTMMLQGVPDATNIGPRMALSRPAEYTGIPVP